MADFAAYVGGVFADSAGIQVTLNVVKADGHTINIAVPVAFASSTTQINTQLADQVRQQLPAYGIPVAQSDRIRIFGGVV